MQSSGLRQFATHFQCFEGLGESLVHRRRAAHPDVDWSLAPGALRDLVELLLDRLSGPSLTWHAWSFGGEVVAKG